MEVNGPGSVQGAFPVKPVQQTPETAQPTESQSITPQDEVEISSAGRMMETLNQSSELRAERLAQIKSEIESGTYETPDKLEAALERLLDEINSE
ncbi:MAG: flagellar biosynthesis protein FlgM [Planctomycetaceae bacterium]|nr:flagellar biosynthesis protein FlgM [Planctomycetaceae bacterium]